MRESQVETDGGDETAVVLPTDPDYRNRQKTAPAPTPAPSAGSADETADVPPVPPTDPGSDHDKVSVIGGAGAVRDDGDMTAPVTGPPSDLATADFPPGGDTADATASGGDRNDTDGFSLDPRFADPETTLPPSPNERIYANGMPRIAGYEVLGVLGEGGMGIVYKARHLRLKRDVALKMIRSAAGNRPHVLARFEAEAQAVAGIKHPNIIEIFDIGEHDGRPYFSLEFLGGGTLGKKIGGKPQPAGEAARIVEVLARAMWVVHQHKDKIIHRDLKPANVLIDEDGTLKISDFGLVKQLEGDVGQTISGAILGTPSYMAPEQARGESNIGQAADQYALGAILYELLTGRVPFQGMSTLDTLDMVRSKDPVPPSQLQTRMPRDIETICLKCLQKEPARRYATVLELAEDLRRFQAGEPILARPVSAAERLWRWCLRNQRVAVLSAAVALLFVVVFVVVAESLVVVSDKNTKLLASNQKLDNANTELKATNQKLDDAIIELGEKNSELGDKNIELAEAKKEADRKRDLAERSARAANQQNRSAVESYVDMIVLFVRTLKDVPAIQATREKELEKVAKRIESVAQSMTNLRDEIGWDPKDEGHNWRTLARAHQGLAELNRSRNQPAEAMKHLRKADEIMTTCASTDPSDLDLQIMVVRARRTLGFFAMYTLGNHEEAQEFFRQAIAICRACLAKHPENDLCKSELANSLGQLAVSELRLRHLDKAREVFREEVAIRQSFSTALANTRESRRELSGLYEQLADLTLRLGDPAEGRRLYDECAAIRYRMAKEQPDSWPILNDLARSYNNEGMIRFPFGHDPAAARGFHRKAAEIFEKRVKVDPTDAVVQLGLAQTLYYESTCALHSGDAPGASAGYRRCLEIFKVLASGSAGKESQADLMLTLARCGEHAEAAKIAGSMVATPPRDEALYFKSACGYALAAGAAGRDADLIRRYTDEALACLRKARARGWSGVVDLEIDPDLEPIRKDPQFQALLAEFRRPGEKHP